MYARSVAAPGLVVLGVAVAVTVETTTESALLADLCYLGVMVGASVAAWLGVLRAQPGRRLVPALIAAGISTTALGDVLWSVLDRAGMDTDVSLADPAWFASYVFLAAALGVVLSRSRVGGRDDLDFALDAITILVVSLLVFWRVSVDAIVADASVPGYVRVVWATYPIMDAVLLALVVRVLSIRSARAVIDSWFAAGVCLWLVADIAYLLWPEQGTAVVLMDAGWMIAPVLMARAAWRAGTAPVGPPSAPIASGWVSQMLIAVCPLLVPPLLELVADLRSEPDQPGQLLVGMVLVIALAFVRTGRLLRSEERALRHLEEARDEALAASGAKSMFLANISHEIRTPLTTVVATAELLDDTSLDDVQRRLLGKMQRSGDQLASLVESILDFSRVEAGKAELEPVPFELRGVVADIADAHLPRAQRSGVRLDWSVQPQVPQAVVGDPLRVFQILSNLVDNAIKFTHRGAVSVTVGVDDEDPGLVRIEVSDTGIGISAADREAVFDSFHQVDGSSTRRFGGSGLGLAICRELTTLMGGTIAVESEVGVGSSFVVRLPLPPAAPTA